MPYWKCTRSKQFSDDRRCFFLGSIWELWYLYKVTSLSLITLIIIWSITFCHSDRKRVSSRINASANSPTRLITWLEEKSSEVCLQKRPSRISVLNHFQHHWDTFGKDVQAHHTTLVSLTVLWKFPAYVWHAKRSKPFRRLLETIFRHRSFQDHSSGDSFLIRCI